MCWNRIEDSYHQQTNNVEQSVEIPRNIIKSKYLDEIISAANVPNTKQFQCKYTLFMF